MDHMHMERRQKKQTTKLTQKVTETVAPRSYRNSAPIFSRISSQGPGLLPEEYNASRAT